MNNFSDKNWKINYQDELSCQLEAPGLLNKCS